LSFSVDGFDLQRVLLNNSDRVVCSHDEGVHSVTTRFGPGGCCGFVLRV
jgi:hypothetical protein